MHTGTICAEYRALKRKYRLSSTDYHRILNQMIDGGLLLDSNDSKSGSKAESESGESSTTHSEPKRRKKRKREESRTGERESGGRAPRLRANNTSTATGICRVLYCTLQYSIPGYDTYP